MNKLPFFWALSSTSGKRDLGRTPYNGIFKALPILISVSMFGEEVPLSILLIEDWETPERLESSVDDIFNACLRLRIFLPISFRNSFIRSTHTNACFYLMIAEKGKIF